MKFVDKIMQLFEILYPGKGLSLSDVLIDLLQKVTQNSVSRKFVDLANKKRENIFSNKSAILITYPDMLNKKNKIPLEILDDFSKKYLIGLFSHIHILPFFPSSSDEGFSVMDYYDVNQDLGTWENINTIADNFNLIFDFVINHASAKGKWFKNFLSGKSPYDRYFLIKPSDYNVSEVFRPRTHPLLTNFKLVNGKNVSVWTTFSQDQVDLDFSNPEVLISMIKVFLFYLSREASAIRLDAIAYIWKDEGTNCLNRPKVHIIVKLFRCILDYLGLDVALLTETNLPHEINISYFGNHDEANLVYNFALPPLVLHAWLNTTAKYLSSWASKLSVPENGNAFLNFLASHDGIGITPAYGILPEEELKNLVETVSARGGLVSYRKTPDGIIPYEINSTFLDAVCGPTKNQMEKVKIFLSCYALICSISGIPAVYFHSLVGSPNWIEGPVITGSNRSINRERISVDVLEAELNDKDSVRHMIFNGLSNILRKRQDISALGPNKRQRVLKPDGSGEFLETTHSLELLNGSVFGLIRGEGKDSTLVLINLSEKEVPCILPKQFFPLECPIDPTGIFKEADLYVKNRKILLPGYGTIWINGNFEGD